MELLEVVGAVAEGASEAVLWCVERPSHFLILLLNLLVFCLVGFTVYAAIQSMADANPERVLSGWITIGVPVAVGLGALLPANWLMLRLFRD